MTRIKQAVIISILLAGCFILLLVNTGRTQFSASVIDLLPGKDSETRILRELATYTQGRQLTIRLFSDSMDVSEQAATVFLDALNSSATINKVWRTGQKGFREIGSLLFEDRYFWLLPHWIEQHFPDSGSGKSLDAREMADKIVGDLNAYLQSPDGMMLVDLIPRDPFLLMDGLDRRLPLHGGPATEGEIYLWAEQQQSPFSDDGQKPVFDALASALQSARSVQQDLQMEFTGVSVFANASKEAIKGEIQRLNFMGIVLVLLISVFAVRSIRAMARIVLVVAIALIVAVTTVVTVFESVHVIALVIGSILTGIAVDYGFHLILRDEYCLSDKDTRKAVISGSLSSALGFLVLIGAPLPFLSQVGVFVGAGLIAALLAAMVLRGDSQNPINIKAWKFNPCSLPGWTGMMLVALAIPGLFLLKWKSNIKDLEYPLPELMEVDSRIMQDSSTSHERHSYLVIADDILTARHKLADIDPANAFNHAGRILPAYEDVVSTHERVRQLDGFRKALVSRLLANDFYPDAFDAFFEEWDAYIELSIDRELYENKIAAFSSRLPGPLRSLVHSGNEISWFMIISPAELNLSADADVVHLDQANMLSRAFSEYGEVMWIFSLICLIVLTISVCLYFGLRSGLEALMTPFIAGIMAFGVIGYWHGDVGLFHIVGALLAFCISLDSGLFAVSSRRTGKKLPKSITISSITTLAVFGVLASSHVPAVQQLATMILLVLGFTLLVIMIRWPGSRTNPVAQFELIPHGPAARMVDQILHVDGNSIRALCNPHADQAMPAECLIEAMAQCAALLLAESKSSSKPRTGMLVVVQSCRLYKRYLVPQEVVEASVQLQSDAKEGLILFSGCCNDAENNLLAEARFSIFIPPASGNPQ